MQPQQKITWFAELWYDKRIFEFLNQPLSNLVVTKNYTLSKLLQLKLKGTKSILNFSAVKQKRRLYKSKTSCISSCLLIVILITYRFGFMPYLIASPLLFNSCMAPSTAMSHSVRHILGDPFVHPRTCSVAFCHTSFITFHLLSTLSVSNTSSFLFATTPANSCLTLRSLSFHILSLVCAFFFFLVASLMMTSPTRK